MSEKGKNTWGSDIHPDFFNEPEISLSFPHCNLEMDKEVADFYGEEEKKS